MAAHSRPIHDCSLFEVIVSHVREIDPEVRTGAMFGCPAVFAGRRMALCVYGDGVGAKVPEADAKRLIVSGVAVAFRPYGRPAMKEWIELRVEPEDIGRAMPILALAVRYARELAMRRPKR